MEKRHILWFHGVAVSQLTSSTYIFVFIVFCIFVIMFFGALDKYI